MVSDFVSEDLDSEDFDSVDLDSLDFDSAGLDSVLVLSDVLEGSPSESFFGLDEPPLA